jgi:diguanylate cyclase (GGDEF)-like protein
LSADDALQYAERIRATLAQTTVYYEGTLPSPTVTIGVAFAERMSECAPDAMVHIADRALYEAKAQGRNCVFLKMTPEPTALPLAEVYEPLTTHHT